MRADIRSIYKSHFIIVDNPEGPFLNVLRTGLRAEIKMFLRKNNVIG